MAAGMEGSTEQFQSTPPHGRRHVPHMQQLQVIVSIHASAWEATGRHRSRPPDVPVQSTPPHGRRRRRCTLKRCGGCFNPRLRMGGDAGAAPSNVAGAVSIHASAWEATTHPAYSHA